MLDDFTVLHTEDIDVGRPLSPSFEARMHMHGDEVAIGNDAFDLIDRLRISFEAMREESDAWLDAIAHERIMLL